MISPEAARAFATEWIDAWNRHDLAAIMAHYVNPPEHASPLIVERLGRADGTLRTLAELEDYFRRGLAAHPTLAFELVQVFPGVSSVGIVYRNHSQQTVLEMMQLDLQGQVIRSSAHYAAESGPLR